MKNKIGRKVKTVDLLNGTLLDKIIYFAIPIAISSALQQLFNSVDAAVVGKFVGSLSLAAVGVNGPLISLFVNLLAGSSVGANVIIATFIGSKQYEKIKTAEGSCVAFSLLIGLILGIIGQFVSEPILSFMGTPKEIVHLAGLYLKIYFLGMPFIMLYNFLAAILRANGDTKRPLVALFAGGIINVFLNIFLIVVFGMGVEGVAIATVVSNMISCLLIVYWLIKDDSPIKLYISSIRFYINDFMRIIAIGLPAGLQGAAFSVSNIFIQTAINACGPNTIAGHTIALNYESLAFLVENAFSQAVVTFVSANFAAGNTIRCKKSTLYCLLGSIISYIIAAIFFNVFSIQLLSIFTNDMLIIEQAQIRVRMCITLLFLSSFYEILGGALRGLGHSIMPAVIVLLGTCLFRITWIYFLLPPTYVIRDIYIVYPITWAITSVITTILYLKVARREYNSYGTI